MAYTDNLKTERQAKKLACPFRTSHTIGDSGVGSTTHYDAKCLASDCMAWLWRDITSEGADDKGKRLGHCGRITP